ncbi:MAG: hypothetical protein NT118_11835, partial [Lentisphaerae bacterium]|nr:hypothetical protein [Lentisphaerota bacterium]
PDLGMNWAWDRVLTDLYLPTQYNTCFDTKTEIKIFICPSSRVEHMDFCATDTGAINNGEWPNCYAANVYVFSVAAGPSNIKLQQLVKPSSTILIVDKKVGVYKTQGVAVNTVTGDWPMLDDKNPDTGRVGYYHSLGVNILWADGHVSWEKGGTLKQSDWIWNL